MPNADAPVVIVGAGLVGASLALALSQRLPQVSIVLIDQQGPQQPLPAAQFDPRVVALNLASQSLLAQLGVWAAVERQCAYEQMQVWDGEGSGSIEFSAREMGANALGWIVENGELLAELHRLIALAPRITWLCDSVQALHRQGETYCLQTLKGAEIPAALILAADGAALSCASWPLSRCASGPTATPQSSAGCRPNCPTATPPTSASATKARWLAFCRCFPPGSRTAL